MSDGHHTIKYIEFTVRDLQAAKRFYAAAFGWQFNDYGPEYAGIQGADGEVGGFHQSTENRTTGPLPVLYSDDLEQSLAAVRCGRRQDPPRAVLVSRRPAFPLRGSERQRARRLVGCLIGRQATAYCGAA